MSEPLLMAVGQSVDDADKCPKCGVSFKGPDIPAAKQQFFGTTHFTRRVGITDGESVHSWECPDCKHTWPRTGVKPGMYRAFEISRR